jgi:hypothetical protein
MNTRSLALPLLCVALIAVPARAAEGTPAAKPEAAPPAGASPKAPPAAPDPNESYGFAITRQLVDRAKIIAGGPGRDGIHAIDAPSFAGPEAADAIAPETPVLGVSIDGDARAYPIPILEYHQIVTTRSGVPIAVSYDPLTGAPLAWKRSVGGRTLRFGVSGLLYNSGFLLYDRETESLWSQFDGRAIAGPLAGKQLTAVPLRRRTLRWLARGKQRSLIPEPITATTTRAPTRRMSSRTARSVEARDRRFHARNWWWASS